MIENGLQKEITITFQTNHPNQYIFRWTGKIFYTSVPGMPCWGGTPAGYE